MKKLLLFLCTVLLFATSALYAQTTYYWVGGNGASTSTATAIDWTANSWNTQKDGGGTVRTVSAANDILVFDGSSPLFASNKVFYVRNIPKDSTGQLQIINGATVTVASSLGFAQALTSYGYSVSASNKVGITVGTTTASSLSVGVVPGLPITGTGIAASSTITGIANMGQTVTATVTSGNAVIQLIAYNANLITGLPVSGTGIDAGTTISSVGSRFGTTLTGNTGTSASITNITTTNLAVGMGVYGSGVPANARITAINTPGASNDGTITISAPTTTTLTGASLSFTGQTVTMSRSATATNNGVAVNFATISGTGLISTTTVYTAAYPALIPGVSLTSTGFLTAGTAISSINRSYATASLSGATTSLSASITSITTTGIAVGMSVTGTGIPAGTVVTAINTAGAASNGTITISANATATGTSSDLVFTGYALTLAANTTGALSGIAITLGGAVLTLNNNATSTSTAQTYTVNTETGNTGTIGTVSASYGGCTTGLTGTGGTSFNTYFSPGDYIWQSNNANTMAEVLAVTSATDMTVAFTEGGSTSGSSGAALTAIAYSRIPALRVKGSLTIDGTSTLNFGLGAGSTNLFILSIAKGATGSVLGTVNFASRGWGSRLVASDAGSLVFGNGGSCNYNTGGTKCAFLGNTQGTGSAAGATFAFNTGGPAIVFASGSNFTMTTQGLTPFGNTYFATSPLIFQPNVAFQSGSNYTQTYGNGYPPYFISGPTTNSTSMIVVGGTQVGLSFGNIVWNTSSLPSYTTTGFFFSPYRVDNITVNTTITGVNGGQAFTMYGDFIDNSTNTSTVANWGTVIFANATGTVQNIKGTNAFTANLGNVFTNVVVANGANVLLQRNITATGSLYVSGTIDFGTYNAAVTGSLITSAYSGGNTYTESVTNASNIFNGNGAYSYTQGGAALGIYSGSTLNQITIGASVTSATGEIPAGTFVKGYNGSNNFPMSNTATATNAAASLTFTTNAKLVINNSGGLTYHVTAANYYIFRGTNFTFTTATTTPFTNSTQSQIVNTTYNPNAGTLTTAGLTFTNTALSLGTVKLGGATTFNKHLVFVNTLDLNNYKLTIPATATAYTPANGPGGNQYGGDSVIVLTGNAVLNYSSTNFIETQVNTSTGQKGVFGMEGVSSVKVLPVGLGTNYLPITVTPTVASGFYVTAFNGATTDGTPNGTATSTINKVDAVYLVNRSNPTTTSSFTLAFGYPAGLATGTTFKVAADANIGINKYSGSWGVGTGTSDTANKTVYSSYGTSSNYVNAFLSNPVPYYISSSTTTSYYLKAGGTITTPSHWATGSNGTSGSNPASINDDAAIWNLTSNNTNNTLSGAWALGTGSQVIINGSNLTIAAAGSITGGDGIDLSTGNTLTINSTADVPVISNINNGSTVVYGPPSGTTYNVVDTAYGFLTLTGAGTVVFPSDTFSVYKNFINSSTGTVTLDPATAFTFNGIAAQTVQVTQSGFAFNALTLNNSTGLTLSSAVRINGALTLTSGKLTIGTNDLTLSGSVSLASASTYVVAASTGYVRMPVVKTVAKLFPIGITANYTPITVTNTNVNTNDTALVNVGTTLTKAADDATQVVNLQWNVLATTATTASVVYQFNTTSPSNIAAGFLTGSACELGNNTVGSAGPYTISNNATTVSALGGSGTPYTFTTTTNVSLPITGVNYYVIANTGNLVVTASTWLGVTSTDWATGSNWDNGVPSSVNAVINAGGYAPTINSGTKTVKNLTVNSGATVTMASGTVLQASGTFVNSGTITGAGTLTLNGTANQAVSGVGTISNLTLNNTAATSPGATISATASMVNITGILTLTAGTLTTNGFLTLKSTSITNTAVLAPVVGAITGNVTVERFIPMGLRAYRDISTCVNGKTSSPLPYIFNNWQENGTDMNTLKGYGIYITGGSSVGSSQGQSAAGFDYSYSGSTSMWSFGAATNASSSSGYAGGPTQNSWVAITNTKTTALDGVRGYRVLIRGDRSWNIFTTPQGGGDSRNGPGPMQTPTTLRATGSLITGPVYWSRSNGSQGTGIAALKNDFSYFGLFGTASAPPAAANGNNFSLIANPYACPIDWQNIYNNSRIGTGLSSSYWYLDPTIGSANRYVVYNPVSQVSSYSSYISTADPLNDSTASVSKVGRYLQAGQGFFVRTIAANPTLSLTEADKVTTSNARVAIFDVADAPNKIVVSLLKQSTTSTAYRAADAAVAVFKNTFTNGVGEEDSYRLGGSTDNLFIVNQTDSLSIEGRLPATVTDTIRLVTDGLDKTLAYRLFVDATAYVSNGLAPYLVDAYKNTATALTVGATNTIDFSADANATSVGQRFSIVFKPSVLSVNSIKVTAVAQASGVAVNWNTIGEHNAVSYDVERATDGVNFSKQTSVAAKNTATAEYSYTDATAKVGNNYYRIKAIGTNGVSYSQVVLVKVGGAAPSLVSIYPNPIIGNKLNIAFSNVAAGSYHVSINNSIGQQVFACAVQNVSGTISLPVSLGHYLPAGSYEVAVTNAAGKILYQTKLVAATK